MELGVQNQIFLVQTVDFGSFGCSPSTSSDFAEICQNHSKKLDLAERTRMHRSRASGASNLLRYGRFCAKFSQLFPAAARLLDSNLSAKDAQLHLSGHLCRLSFISRLPGWSLPVFPAAAFLAIYPALSTGQSFVKSMFV